MEFQYRIGQRGSSWILWVAGLVVLALVVAVFAWLARPRVVPRAAGDPPAQQISNPPPSPPPMSQPAVVPTSTPTSQPGSLPQIATSLGPGASGPDVVALQQRLQSLSYLTGAVNGTYGSSTGYAVTAFQKVAGLPRTGVIDPATQAALQSATVPAPAYTAPPDHIEVDLARQVLFVVSGGQVGATVAISSGTDRKFYEQEDGRWHQAITPNGVFTVAWKYKGWWHSPLGDLFNPAFIDNQRGIAIHGYSSVPPDPASHGCIRVPLAFADAIDQATPVGQTVFVHGGPDGPNP